MSKLILIVLLFFSLGMSYIPREELSEDKPFGYKPKTFNNMYFCLEASQHNFCFEVVEEKNINYYRSKLIDGEYKLIENPSLKSQYEAKKLAEETEKTNKKNKRKTRVIKLKQCLTGDYSSANCIKSLIREVLKQELKSSEM